MLTEINRIKQSSIFKKETDFFSIFDEIKCDINSLNINSIGQNKYSVTYVITIKGFIYDEDIEHTEKSSVNEEIVIDNGTPKIFKTLSGKYWKTR